jgi:hypothetical protein
MSGGHFGNCGYDYYKVAQFADELEEEIRHNGKAGTDGDHSYYYSNFEPETINYLRKQLIPMRKMAEIMRHIDYLYSGDHGEDSFMVRVKEVEKHWKECEDLATRMDKWNEEDGV